jgi:hypothetical protein
MKFKKLAFITLTLTVATGFVGCSGADVVGKTAITSFDAVVNKLGDQVSFDEGKNHWVLTSPTGETFELSKDFSSNVSDASVEFDAAPFVAAGLNIEKLVSDQYVYDQATDKITMPFEIGQNKFSYSGDAAPLDTFKQIVETNRKNIGYHAELDHYGLSLGNGNMFEWAKDMTKNDKDIVFVLNPLPLIEAGVDPSKVEGWVFAKVKVSDGKGKMVEVDKFLKPFDLN